MQPFIPFWKKVYSKESQFFPCRVDQFLEGAWRAVKQTGNHKSCLPVAEMAKNLPSVSSLLNIKHINPCPA